MSEPADEQTPITTASGEPVKVISAEKEPAPLTKYLVLSKDADKDQWWIEVGTFEARAPHKAIEQAMAVAKRDQGTFAAVPQSKWTVKSPRSETSTRIVWD